MPNDDWLTARLTAELGDPMLAREFASIVNADALVWAPPLIAPQRVRVIVGFTFGNRMLSNGNREPGPVNEALGALAARLHRDTGAPVIAQWEVAVVAATHLPPGVVTPIHPARDMRDEPVYLSTLGVLEEVARRWVPTTVGAIGVVAFADHIARAVATARRLGFDAYAPAGYAMPTDYDSQAGQAWCRSRLLYLVHDMTMRISERRTEMLASARGA
jgi:hypothetical protein